MPRRSEIILLFNGRPKSCQTVVGHQGPSVTKGPFPWQASKAANKRPAQGMALSNLLRMARKFVPAAALKKPGIFLPQGHRMPRLSARISDFWRSLPLTRRAYCRVLIPPVVTIV